jgi:hypothetical protein
MSQEWIDPHPRRDPEVQAKIDAAMRAADEHADDKWKHIFDACILMASTKHAEITVDDVIAEMEKLPNPPSTHNLSAIGSAMKRAAKMGVLTYTDRVQRSNRPEKNGNRHNVWISNYYKPEQLDLPAR